MKKIWSLMLRLKNPCKKCLVLPTCTKIGCEQYDKYSEMIERISDLKLLIFVLGSLGFIGTTFILGCYQWYQNIIFILKKIL